MATKFSTTWHKLGTGERSSIHIPNQYAGVFTDAQGKRIHAHAWHDPETGKSSLNIRGKHLRKNAIRLPVSRSAKALGKYVEREVAKFARLDNKDDVRKLAIQNRGKDIKSIEANWKGVKDGTPSALKALRAGDNLFDFFNQSTYTIEGELSHIDLDRGMRERKKLVGEARSAQSASRTTTKRELPPIFR